MGKGPDSNKPKASVRWTLAATSSKTGGYLNVIESGCRHEAAQVSFVFCGRHDAFYNTHKINLGVVPHIDAHTECPL